LTDDVSGNVVEICPNWLLKAMQGGEIGDGRRLVSVSAETLKDVSIVDKTTKSQSIILVLAFADRTNEGASCLI